MRRRSRAPRSTRLRRARSRERTTGSSAGSGIRARPRQTDPDPQQDRADHVASPPDDESAEPGIPEAGEGAREIRERVSRLEVTPSDSGEGDTAEADHPSQYPKSRREADGRAFVQAC